MKLVCLLLSITLSTAYAESEKVSDMADAASLIRDLGLRTTPIEEWKKPTSVVVLLPPSAYYHRQDFEEWWLQAADDVDVHLVRFSELSSEQDTLSKANAVFGACDPRIIRPAKNLHYLHNYGAGLDRCSFDKDIVNRDLIITNGQGAAGPTMAEHVVGMMLTLSRNLHLYRDQQDQEDWRDIDTPRPIALANKTVLILGLGGIGREVAKRSNAFGMRVIATRNSSREGPDYVTKVGLADETLELAAQADFVVNTLPLTDATRGLINKEFFAAMPKGGYYINVGRGKSTVTDDLMEALKNGTLSGAALDVTDPEPLPRGHPLWDLPNVIITPHMSGSSNQSNRHRWIVARENLRRYVRGEDLINVVDLKRGY